MPRPPKPTATLKLTGGYRADRHGDRTDDATDIPDVLECPDDLDEAAKAEWSRVVDVLGPLGLATSLDRAILTTYCVSWSRWREAEREIAQRGLVVEGHRGVMVPNPMLRVARDARDAMNKAARELGMTPTARVGLDLPKKFEPNALDELMARRQGIEQFISPELRR